MKPIDHLLNRFTMYQITLYALIAYVIYATLMAFFNFITYSPVDILLSVAVTITVCYLSNFVFAKVFNAVTNFESVFITALILTLIIPPKFPQDAAFIALASVIAMAVKYLPTVNKRHIFNPAAGAVFAYAILFPTFVANWWIGTPVMIVPVLIGGFLIVRKAQRQEMVLTFLGAFLVIIAITTFIRFGTLGHVLNVLKISTIQSATIFFATIMLTEPITSPSKQKLRRYYAVLVAFLYATPQLRQFGLVFTPEESLLIGNIFSFIVNPKHRLSLPLLEMRKLSPTIYAFLFPKDKSFTFTPGEYMEWTLPHKNMDSRGNRRYLSLASSPTEDTVLAVIRYYEPPSSYKKNLIAMQKGETITAINLSGDFILPKNLSTPIAFIAGGVGITPFRSMIQYIVDKQLKCDIVLLFINKTPDEIVFQDVFKKAEAYGVRTVYHTSSTDGHVTEEVIKKNIPDYMNRIFYMSGSQLMVSDLKKILKGLKVKKIKTDFFPGYSE